MQIRYSKIFIIQNDIPSAQEAAFVRTDNVQEYIETITTELTSDVVKRNYQFDETYQTAYNNILFIIERINAMTSLLDEDARKIALDVELKHFIESQPANRLASIEKEFNDTYIQFAHIPRGVLIVTDILDDNGNKKLILAKADYAEFMEEDSGDKKLGLPTKKKIYKAVTLTYDYNMETHSYDIFDIIVYDTGNKDRDAKYWWKSFLELKELRSNQVNTKKAYYAIKNKIIIPLKKDYKADYISLSNINISYFSTTSNFDIEDYVRELEDYEPVSNNLNKELLINKLRNLPGQIPFDTSFQKDPSVITDRMKKYTISLGLNMDLSIKGEIENIRHVIKAQKDEEGNKTVVICSELGFDYFKSNSNSN